VGAGRTGWRGRKTGCSFGSEVGPFCSVGGRRSRCCFENGDASRRCCDFNYIFSASAKDF